MKKAKVNGVELEYASHGSGEPLLLISPVLADGFLPLLSEPALAAAYNLITYHKRGWAGSTRTAPPVSVADHARDAAALLDYLGIRRAHVAGHSSGAAVALQLAIDFPGLVHSLGLLELSLLSAPSAKGLFEKAGPAFEAHAAGDSEAALAIFMSAVSGLGWDACRKLLNDRMPGSVQLAVQDADTFFGVELPALTEWSFGPADAALVSQPVLSVLGEETEPLWVDIAAMLRSWLPDVEECTIEGAGHLLHLQRPEAVAACLASFLQRHPLAEQPRLAVGRDVTQLIV
jgi:pimeloyl-ACP methyl ester carboxylesterase